MKVLKQAAARRGNGVLVLTVELEPGESLMAFKDGDYYRLGGQVDDVVKSHVITEARAVAWCSVSQEWTPA